MSRKPGVRKSEARARHLGLKAATVLVVCVTALSAETIVIRNVDVYPVSAPEMKGVSVLIQDGKIADIGPKLLPPKGARVIEGKGLRVYPGMIDSGTELGLSEVSS